MTRVAIVDSRREMRGQYLQGVRVVGGFEALAELFGVKVPAVNKHLKNIFESEKLMEAEVISILEHTLECFHPFTPHSALGTRKNLASGTRKGHRMI